MKGPPQLEPRIAPKPPKSPTSGTRALQKLRTHVSVPPSHGWAPSLPRFEVLKQLFHTSNLLPRGSQLGQPLLRVPVHDGEVGLTGRSALLGAAPRGEHFMWEFFGFLCQREQQPRAISRGLPSAAWLLAGSCDQLCSGGMHAAPALT